MSAIILILKETDTDTDNPNPRNLSIINELFTFVNQLQKIFGYEKIEGLNIFR